MEKLLKSYDKEYMKMAMLKHEETFKQQVYELHRLYQIQKILMKRIDENRHNRERWDSRTLHQKPRRGIDLEQPPEEEYTEELDGDGGIDQIEDESEIQLTLGPTSYYRRKKAESTPRTHSDSPPSFSSSSTGSSHIMKRKSLGSTHQHQWVADRRNEELTGHTWGLTVVPRDDDSSNLDFQNGGRRRRNSSDVDEEQWTQDRVRNQPSSLFRALTLNMT